MGTCYTYLLFKDFYDVDEYDFEAVKKEYPVATLEAKWGQYLVIDLDKVNPNGERIQELQKYCDKAYYYTDNYPGYIEEVIFKPLPKDPVVEANQPEHRNKKYIDEAYSSWKDTFNATNSNN